MSEMHFHNIRSIGGPTKGRRLASERDPCNNIRLAKGIYGMAMLLNEGTKHGHRWLDSKRDPCNRCRLAQCIKCI